MIRYGILLSTLVVDGYRNNGATYLHTISKSRDTITDEELLIERIERGTIPFDWFVTETGILTEYRPYLLTFDV